MEYKFRSKNISDASIEFSQDNTQVYVQIMSSPDDYSEPVWLDKNDVDDLILALTDIKNRITRQEKNVD